MITFESRCPFCQTFLEEENGRAYCEYGHLDHFAKKPLNYFDRPAPTDAEARKQPPTVDMNGLFYAEARVDQSLHIGIRAIRDFFYHYRTLNGKELADVRIAQEWYLCERRAGFWVVARKLTFEEHLHPQGEIYKHEVKQELTYNDLPALTGSRRQIEWGEDVRWKIVKALELELMVRPRADYEIKFQKLLTMTDSTFWIRNRKQDMYCFLRICQ